MANLITSTFEFPSYDIFMRDIVYKMEEYYKGMIDCDMIHDISLWEYTMLRQIWANMKKDETILVCLSGRGDKDVNQVADIMGVSL